RPWQRQRPSRPGLRHPGRPVAAGGPGGPVRPGDRPGQPAMFRGGRRRAGPEGPPAKPALLRGGRRRAGPGQRPGRHPRLGRRIHRALRTPTPMSSRRPTRGETLTASPDPPTTGATELAAATAETLRADIAAALVAARGRTALLTDCVDENDLIRPHSPLMSPLVWDLAHIANQEEMWLLRAVGGQDPIHPEIDPLYDAFEHPRSERPTLPLLAPGEARGYAADVRGRVLDLLERVSFSGRRLVTGGFAFGMIVQHEQQHDETMLITHQLRKGGAVPAAPPPPAPP